MYIYFGLIEVYSLLDRKREASTPRTCSSYSQPGQKVLNAIAELLRLSLGEVVEEAVRTVQAVLIVWPGDIVVYNELCNRVSILFEHGIEVLKDVRVEPPILSIGVNEEVFMIVFIISLKRDI